MSSASPLSLSVLARLMYTCTTSPPPHQNPPPVMTRSRIEYTWRYIDGCGRYQTCVTLMFRQGTELEHSKTVAADLLAVPASPMYLKNKSKQGDWSQSNWSGLVGEG
eukprot:1186844-Prorocentrum_minimum.AAC.1